MPEHTPFALPTPSGVTEPSHDLTDTQLAMLQAVKDHFLADGYTLPGEEKGELTELEKFWLSHECMLRYLRATKWAQATAIQRLEGTLKWRREFGFGTEITPEHVEPEALTGKQITFGFDVDRRPGCYMFPSRQNTEESVRQIQFSIWNLERCIDLMGPGIENVTLFINYGDKGSKGPSMAQSRFFLNILQTHYPERLGRALIINVPWALSMFFKLISPFIDPHTRTKMRFNPSVVKDGLVASDQLVKEWGGERDFVYEHEQYWPALVKITDERRQSWMQKWRELGGTVGIKEWDYKSVDAAPVSSP